MLAPRITKIDDRLTSLPAGASREVAVLQTRVDWSDGAQTARNQGAPWLCVHPGANWPDALETCQHIAALEGGQS